jgi:hypothetical protein
MAKLTRVLYDWGINEENLQPTFNTLEECQHSLKQEVAPEFRKVYKIFKITQIIEEVPQDAITNPL